jgi:preprotein translocase subunit SecG
MSQSDYERKVAEHRERMEADRHRREHEQWKKRTEVAKLAETRKQTKAIRKNNKTQELQYSYNEGNIIHSHSKPSRRFLGRAWFLIRYIFFMVVFAFIALIAIGIYADKSDQQHAEQRTQQQSTATHAVAPSFQ